MAEPIVYIYSSNTEPKDMTSFKMFVKKIAKGAQEDFKLTKDSMTSKVIKTGAGVPAVFGVSKQLGTLPPVIWTWNLLSKRVGALPIEFTASGNLQVLRLSCIQRSASMLGTFGTAYLLVTISYNGGLVVGSVINQFLSQETKDTIGGTINQIIYEEGWKELWKHPLGYGLCWGK